MVIYSRAMRGTEVTMSVKPTDEAAVSIEQAVVEKL